jgi:hypothetical protein
MNKAGSPDTKAGVFLGAVPFTISNEDFLFVHDISSYRYGFPQGVYEVTRHNGEKRYYRKSDRVYEVLECWNRLRMAEEAFRPDCTLWGGPSYKKFNIQKKIYKPVGDLALRCLGRLLDLLGL